MTDLNLANILNNINDQEKKQGLYIIATPIGNILDISIRALFILEYADIVLAEDTRVTRKLLSFYGISKRLISYHDHNAAKVTAEMIEKLQNEKISIALVSDAGTPLVSDPGYRIVKACIENNIYVTTIPGACSAVCALILSGICNNNFYFHGFLPYKTAARKKELETLKCYNTSIIIFESPYRIIRSLEDMLEVLGDIEIALAREISKKFEEVIRGPINTVLTSIKSIKGEFVIVLNNRKL